MSNIITITKKSLVPVGTTEVKLPCYYATGQYFKHYVCITEELVIISFYAKYGSISIDTKQYEEEDMDILANRIERDMREDLYEPIDEAVFKHLFSEAHRNLFYQVNPNLKPIE